MTKKSYYKHFKKESSIKLWHGITRKCMKNANNFNFNLIFLSKFKIYWLQIYIISLRHTFVYIYISENKTIIVNFPTKTERLTMLIRNVLEGRWYIRLTTSQKSGFHPKFFLNLNYMSLGLIYHISYGNLPNSVVFM